MKKPKEAHFQNYAFDKDLDRSFEAVDCRITRQKRGIFNELSSLVDFSGHVPGDKGSIGFQIKHFRTGYDKKLPDWVRTKEGIQKLLLIAFPKLQTNPAQRKRAGRWAQAINLNYLLRWSQSQSAAEMNISLPMFKFLIVRINRVASGLTTTGRERRRKQTT